MSDSSLATDDSPHAWREEASCREVEPDIFFPVGGPDLVSAQINAAKAICQSCPVQNECLAYALATSQERGIWGGLSAEERKGLRRGNLHLEVSPEALLIVKPTLVVVSSLGPKIQTLIEALSHTPEELYKLAPREFEELIAELLTRRGYAVQLTRQGRDGGVDIYARKRIDLGENLLFLVQCKRYARTRRVGEPAVRDLYGTVAACRASGGALVTSSFFTSSARSFAKQIGHQITLRDYFTLQDWIRDETAQ